VGELLEQLGIKPLSLLAQIVNFGILLLILWRFLYKPMLKVLSDRRNRIEKSLKDAQQIEEDLESSRAKAQQIVVSANERASQVVAGVEQEAEAKRIEKLRAAESEATQIFKRAEESLKEERARIKRELQAETLTLVTQATERVVANGIDPKTQKRLIDEALKELA
jgi:F-type H+-transporting ATPase subunit b